MRSTSNIGITQHKRKDFMKFSDSKNFNLPQMYYQSQQNQKESNSDCYFRGL